MSGYARAVLATSSMTADFRAMVVARTAGSLVVNPVSGALGRPPSTVNRRLERPVGQ